ncbi:MAG: hypothetical protein ACO1NO_11585 [Burkholderiaceae bacterium]
MSKMSHEDAYQAAINLVEEQLQTLPVSIATILQPDTCQLASSGVLENIVQLQTKRRNKDTGSVGNIVASYANEEPGLNFHAACEALGKDPLQKGRYLKTVIGNALLAVGMFFKEHDMAAMRTPEIQFLDHVCDAILNGNRLRIDPGYMPIATFEGLVIDNKADGMPLFGDAVSAGFMEFGDAIALLQWLSRYLRGERNFVSGGDAG